MVCIAPGFYGLDNPDQGKWSYGWTSLGHDDSETFVDLNEAKLKCDQLGVDDCGSIQLAQDRFKNPIFPF